MDTGSRRIAPGDPSPRQPGVQSGAVGQVATDQYSATGRAGDLPAEAPMTTTPQHGPPSCHSVTVRPGDQLLETPAGVGREQAPDDVAPLPTLASRCAWLLDRCWKAAATFSGPRRDLRLDRLVSTTAGSWNRSATSRRSSSRPHSVERRTSAILLALLGLIGTRHADAEPLAQGSDGQREFVERHRHPLVHWLLAREVVVAASQVLHEAMPNDDHPGAMFLLAPRIGAVSPSAGRDRTRPGCWPSSRCGAMPLAAARPARPGTAAPCRW
jgi:hypothetical protein